MEVVAFLLQCGRPANCEKTIAQQAVPQRSARQRRENARLVAENQKKSGGLLLLLPAGRGKPLQIEGVEIDRVNVKRGVRAATNGVRNDLAREGK